jgi:hypothetical protein
MLRLLDTLCLLLGPLASAWDQEFGSDDELENTHAPQDRSPDGADASVVRACEDVVQAVSPDRVHDARGSAAGELPLVQGVLVGGRPEEAVRAVAVVEKAEIDGEVTDATRNVASATPEVAAPADPVLYVRRGAGRGARYYVAGPDATGTRYRRQVVGGRRRFTPVEASR